jgi:flagellar hook assembly protein FlgD
VTVGSLVTGISARAAQAAVISMRSSGSGYVFLLPAQEGVRVSVIDVHGRVVWNRASEGRTEMQWDGRGAHGARLAAGAYVVRAIARDGGSAKVLAQRSFSML